MRKEHKPYWLKRLIEKIGQTYVSRIIAPQLDHLGEFPKIYGPQYLLLFGEKIRIGNCLHMACDSDRKVRIQTWSHKGASASITIGNYCLISPGVRIMAERSITIGDSCMFGAGAYIADSDWHGLYNRTRPFRCSEPVVLKDNVWIGDGAKVCKGVTIGENSVVGAGAVVTKDVPDNVVVAGVPAKVVKKINPNRKMLTREFLFSDPAWLTDQENQLNKAFLANNSVFKWLKSLIFPTKLD